MSSDEESGLGDDPFHPLGDAAEEDFRAMLEETEYDADLGMAMAEDAMRVTKGELSEAAFHERYHEDVLEEFGEDLRPTAEAFEDVGVEEGTVSAMLEKFDGDGEEGRRDVMKKMGVGAAALGTGALATTHDPEGGSVATAQEDTDDGVQWGMTIDLEHCDGCLSCVTACQQENDWDAGTNWMYVLDFEDPDGGNSGRLVRPCQHCTDAPCEKVCPTTARHTRSKDGLVLTDYDVCIGCRYCQVACPYGVNYFQWERPEVDFEDLPENHTHDERGRWVDSRAPRGVMSKCTMCPSRQDGNMGEENVSTTACQEACPPEIIQFGDMNDENSDPQRYAENIPRGRAISAQQGVGLIGGDETEEELGEDDFELIQAIALGIEWDWDEPPLDLDDDEIDAFAERYRITTREMRYVQVLRENGLETPEDVAENLGIDADDDYEAAAQEIIESHVGQAPVSTFKLLEDVGTNPNIEYIGNEPGPHAKQVDTPILYEDVGMVDNRKDVLDESTVNFEWIAGRF